MPVPEVGFTVADNIIGEFEPCCTDAGVTVAVVDVGVFPELEPVTVKLAGAEVELLKLLSPPYAAVIE